MSEKIPTYELNMLRENRRESTEVFFSGQAAERPQVRIDLPYRSNYYKVAVCRRGCAEVRVNLETYRIERDSLIIMSPQIIKQWTQISDDYESADVFFTERLMTSGGDLNLNKFHFFEQNARHVFQIAADEAKNISSSLEFIQQKNNVAGAYRNDIVRNLITSLLYEITAIYDVQTAVLGPAQTKNQRLAAEFKKLVNVHCSAERNLKFYAANFLITPKHLTETVKQATGKTAGEWIAEGVILEAKILLQNSSLSIALISDTLNFPDQSTFGKYFKKQTGLAPAAYRQTR